MTTTDTTKLDQAVASTPTASSDTPAVDRRTWLATAVMLVAVFMELMDVTMANVAVPAIRTDLGASSGQVQWVVAGYSVAFAAALLTGGRMGDIWGRKKLFSIGLLGFILTSVMSGIAPNPDTLVIGRVLQGVAAAAMLPQVLASISVWFPAEKREAAFGLFGAITGLGGVVAPLIGGGLINADLFGWGWRPIFLINLPIGVVTLIATQYLVRESKAPQRLRLDIIGALAGVAAVLLLVYPVIQGHDAGWPAWGWVMMACAIPAFAGFAALERHRARRGLAVLADLSLFRRRTFTGGLLVTLVFFGGVTAIAFVLMIYLQSGFGYSPLRAGTALVPLAGALIVGSGVSIGLAPKLGKVVLQIGCLIAAGGAIWLSAVIGDHPGTLTIWAIVAPLAVFGLGLGLTVAPLTDSILADIPEENAGMASGLQSTVLQVGNAVGVAVLGAIFFALLGNAGNHSPAMQAPQVAVVRHHFAESMRKTLYYDAGVFGAAAGLVFVMGSRRKESVK